MSKRSLFIIISIFLIIILGLLAYIAYLSLNPASPETIDTSPISILEPPIPMPDFTLTNQAGENVKLSDLRGKAVLLTFGFTHCPDVCPITLGEMRSIHADLGEMSENLHFVFVTVDGSRDTPEVLTDYFATLRVDGFMIGMTGTEQAIREMGIPYGLDFRYSEADALGNYTVEHTAGMFLLNTEGEWIRRYTYGMKNEDITADLRQVLQ